MIFKLAELKDVCSKILVAVDSSDNSPISDILELRVVDGYLNLSVTNMEYYVNVKLKVNTAENFHASVNAGLFLRLIASLTEEDVSLEIIDTYLKIVGNGTYKIPLIYSGSELLQLPEITITNVTQTFVMEGALLHSVLRNNLSELSKGSFALPVQKLVYLDELGAITFTTGACVVDFTLPNPLKLLLTPKVVKLFKLLSKEEVTVKYGIDMLNEDTYLPKLTIADNTTTISSLLTNNLEMLNSVPAKLIRSRASNTYDYSVVLNTSAMLNAIKRLSLFTSKTSKFILTLAFMPTEVKLSDGMDNEEVIKYENVYLADCNYKAKLDADDLRVTLETQSGSHVFCSFGDHQAFVISKQGIHNILPEVI